MNNRRITRTNVDRDGNRYCGPLVIAALLGCSTAEAAAKVREATDSDRTIKGMHNREMIKTLAANGYKVAQLVVQKHYVEDRGFGEPAGVLSYQRGTLRRNTSGQMCHYIDTSEPSCPFIAVKRIGPTLAAWLRSREDKAATYVVNVTDHYVLIAGRKFVDTSTRGEWVNIGKAPHRRTRVENVWQVSR